MLYETIGNCLVESVEADKEQLAFTIVIDVITDANDRNEVRKVLTQCVKGHISNPDAEKRLIDFINDSSKSVELERVGVRTNNLQKENYALNGRLKSTSTQLNKYKSSVIPASIITIISLALAIGSIYFGIKSANSLAPSKAALEDLSNKYSNLNKKHEALNKKLAALNLQNQELLKGNEELEKAFEPTKKENERIAKQSQAAENKNRQLNDRLSRVCKHKRNWFFNKDCN